MRKDLQKFYGTTAWQQCRASYLKSVGGLCERCLAKGLIRAADVVHHKQHLTSDNINNPAVTLSWDNLEALCTDCHAEEHLRNKRRYKVDEYGRVTIK